MTPSPAADPRSESTLTRLPGLDGLRALSIVLVLPVHTSRTLGFPANRTLRAVASVGGFGVTVFFVLSGFLITRLLLQEEARRGRFSLPRFYFRRVFRILPPALAFLLVVSVIGRQLSPAMTHRELYASAFFVRNLVHGSFITGHYWSLAIEEQFYLLWPLTLLLVPRRLRVPATAALVAIAPIWRQINGWIFGFSHVQWTRLDLRYDALLTGALLALVLPQLLERGLPRRVGRWGPPVFAALAVLIGLALVRMPWLPGAAALWLPSIRHFAVAGLVLLLVTRRAGWFGWLLDMPAVQWLGRLSYSLYLWQQLVCFERTTAWYGHFPVNVGVAIVLASASYYLVERPFLRLRSRLSVAGRGRTATS